MLRNAPAAGSDGPVPRRFRTGARIKSESLANPRHRQRGACPGRCGVSAPPAHRRTFRPIRMGLQAWKYVAAGMSHDVRREDAEQMTVYSPLGFRRGWGQAHR